MPKRKGRRVEFPTLSLTVAIYGGWLALVLFWRLIPLPLLCLAGGWCVAWHSSLQHEVLHGHPTRTRWLNDLIGSVPLNFWLPYAIYKSSHLRHHNDENLTDPIEDPESAYLTAAAWRRIGAAGRLFARFNNTLFGRLTVGPLVMILGFLVSEAMAFRRGDTRHALVWAIHLLAVAFVVAFVTLVAGMPLWLYLFGFVYIGAAFSRLRAFPEHRWADHSDERTAIVENAAVFGLLFLNNNLHVLHHQQPQVPWYKLPALYRRERDRLLQANGGLVYNGYGDVLRRYFMRVHDVPVHPRETEARRETLVAGHAPPQGFASFPFPAPALAGGEASAITARAG